MKPRIIGIGWVTAAGCEPGPVFQKIGAAIPPETTPITLPPSPREHRVALVADAPPPELAMHPRLRRASRISLLTADAGMRAIRDAGFDPASDDFRDGLALVFAVSTGSVVYSRKFFGQVMADGSGPPSPLLFPETVFNAPASHLAALLGIDGICETLAGDSAIGISALDRAAELLATDQASKVLVVGGEEIDWVTCEGYHRWRIRPLFAEGAAAVLLANDSSGTPRLEAWRDLMLEKRVRAAAALSKGFDALIAETAPPDLVIGSASGTFIDPIEAEALRQSRIDAPSLFPKRATGEPIGAGALIQVVAAATALRSKKAGRVLVSSAGYRGQLAAAIIS
jgi:3-oxoacyl-(acyl-carrier-protein) synthase